MLGSAGACAAPPVVEHSLVGSVVVFAAVFAVKVYRGVGALVERVWLLAGSSVVVTFLIGVWVGGAES